MTELQANKDLLLSVAAVAADAVLARLYPQLDELSKKQAEAVHGRRWLDFHVAAGDLKPRRKGRAANSKQVFSRTEINALWEAERAGLKKIL